MVQARLKFRNWKQFQHFKDRRPPWIKLYRSLLDDHEWHLLDPDASKSLVMMWLLASETDDGSLPAIKEIAFRLRTTENRIKSVLTKLSPWLLRDDISTISPQHLDITTISPEYHDGPSETETETETEGNDGFMTFWHTYPKKKAKGDAEKAWKTLKPDKHLLSLILTAAERAKASPDWTKDGGQFIPFPATWLRRKGWEDEEFTPLAIPDEPGEFDHLPRINNDDYWICGCPKAGTDVCRSPVHGMTLEESCQFNAQVQP